MGVSDDEIQNYLDSDQNTYVDSTDKDIFYFKVVIDELKQKLGIKGVKNDD